MGVDQEELLDHEQAVQTISFEEARDLAERAHPKLSSAAKDKLAKQLQEHPEQFDALAHALPSISPKDISLRIESYRGLLTEANRAVESAFTPESPHAFYTPQEQRRIRRNQLVDEYLGWIAGTDNASRLETSLQPAVRERFKKRLVGDLESSVAELSAMSSSVEKLRDATEEHLSKTIDDVFRQDTYLGLAEDRLRNIPGEMEEATKELAAARQAGGKSYQGVHQKLQDLRTERTTYRKSVRQSTNSILIDRKQIHRDRIVLAQVAPFYDAIDELAGDMDLVTRSIDMHVTGPFTVVNPEALQRILSLGTIAKGVLDKLDAAVEKYAGGIVDGLRGPMGLGLQQEGELPGLEAKEQRAVQYNVARQKEAREYAKQLRESGPMYLP